MEEKITTTKLDPIETICGLLKMNNPELKHDEIIEGISYIRFDKDMVPEYHIIDSITSDGTMIFTMELLGKTLNRLIGKTTCYLPTKPELPVKDIIYTIGEIELKSEFGMKDLNCGRCPGQTDTVSIPVRCEYILN